MDLGLDSPVERPKQLTLRQSDVFGHSNSNSHSAEMDTSIECLKIKTYLFTEDEDLLTQLFPKEWHLNKSQR
eukprot:CAMPEP_0116884466 /NCGR_PEP_ID=MMETSP0463-20121206/17376_1 /TAXON_ID=181622 /ORGANISM="Strombidinopsis sp, Strain SopsisLIS2011" /LENGTH=71 /DNA_ID=CAMNT_0004541035 /DNA_START=14 /DNA_END=229 /DNA_ORIENTATION=-